ncbi:MAG: DNA repair exonuclease [Calditrichaeota bacterium]|nr:MAG: DNA repair exonuclease [Calditrichota bacterium]MBL1207833.1 DNA repair exonuclease [Calditrichota bacterium]NOG47667.1 DNA repair exonuclease [Calditrichota bacterium]
MQSLKTLKILFFADTHLGFDYPVRPKIKRRRRGYDFFDNYSRILKYASLSKPDLIIHGGDFFFRSKVPSKVVDLAYQPLYDFACSNAIPIYIIPGNHERSVLPQSKLLNHPLINIFDKPKTYKLEIRDTKIQLSGFPFVRKIGECFGEVLKNCAWENHNSGLKLLCMHQAIEGAQVGPSDYTFKIGRDVISKKDLPKNATAVLSGHIHRRQILYKNDIPVIYPGSIERTSFAEKNETKGFYEIHFSQNKLQNWFIDKYHFLRLPSRPMSDIFLSPENNPQNLEAAIRANINYLPQNSIIRFRSKVIPGREFKTLFTSTFIRSLLPATFNFQFGREFYPATSSK